MTDRCGTPAITCPVEEHSPLMITCCRTAEEEVSVVICSLLVTDKICPSAINVFQYQQFVHFCDHKILVIS